MANKREAGEKDIRTEEESAKFIPEKSIGSGTRRQRKKSLSLVIGVVVTFAVCIFDTTGIACLQLMDKLPPDLQINAVNYSFGFVCILVYFLMKQKLPRVKRDKVAWMIAICLVFLVDNLTLYNQEASFLPLGSIGSIGYAFNIIFSVILSKIFLTELITCHKGIGLFITLLGLVLTVLAHVPNLGPGTSSNVSCPVYLPNQTSGSYRSTTEYAGSQLSQTETDEIGHYARVNVSTVNNTSIKSCEEGGPEHKKDFWSEVLAMSLLSVSCFCSALETVMFSGSRLKHEPPATIAFWIFASGCVVLLPATFIFEKPIIPSTNMDITYLFIYSMCAAGLSYLYIIAAQLLMPMFLTIIESFGVPLMFIVQMMFLIHIAKPSNIWLQVAGVILVFISTISLPVIEYMTIRKHENLNREENNIKRETTEVVNTKL